MFLRFFVIQVPIRPSFGVYDIVEVLEGELFLLGHWKNYDELEENLSMPELINTLKALKKKDHEDKKFFASLKDEKIFDNAEDKKS